jgi:hypothetical protein
MVQVKFELLALINYELLVILFAMQTFWTFFSNNSSIFIGDYGPSRYPLIISGVICLNWEAIWDATIEICLRER